MDGLRLEILLLIGCLAGWGISGALLLWRPGFVRLGFFLLMCVWLYISLMLVIVAGGAPLPTLLFCGALPFLLVAAGYGLYEWWAGRAAVRTETQDEEGQ